MFFDADIKGDRLPPRTLCLTYDDGPGPQTLDLGRALHRLGVRATFFAVGRHAEEQPGVLQRLADWGHLVGNHTYSHPGLVKFLADGGDVETELTRTDAAIAPALEGSFTFFRAPYGNWRETDGPGGPDKPTSVVAEALNRTGLASRYVGPVNWDVCGCDWEFWERGDSAEACAAAYLAKAEQVGCGIVLMHDGSEDEAVRARNRAGEATELLVGELLERGYRCVRLDELPQVRSAARVTDQITLTAPDGRSVSRDVNDRLVLRTGGPAEVLGVVPLSGGGTALRAANGCYLSVRTGTGKVAAVTADVGPAETFFLDDEGDGRRCVRAAVGGDWAAGPDGRAVVVGPHHCRYTFAVRRRFSG